MLDTPGPCGPERRTGARAELLEALALSVAAPVALQLVAFVAPDGIADPPWLVQPADRLDSLMDDVAGARGGRAFRVGEWTFAAISPFVGDASHPALELAARLGHQPDMARRLVHADVVLPTEGTGEGALRLGLARLRMRSRWQPLSPARQARDVLRQLLAERRGGLEALHRPAVAAMALAVGRRLGLRLDELDELVRAAELQDIGLLTLPDGILRKRAALSSEDWDVVRRHPIVAERALAAAPALAPVARLVRSCYERWDGCGYPDGLAGRDIPLGARIIAACVAFDAMTTGRPYRAARSEHDALRELDHCAGRQFDPRVIDAFRAVMAEEAASEERAA